MENPNLSPRNAQSTRNDPAKSSFLAALLSFIPGLGHFYLGQKAKGWTYLCMTAGVVVGVLSSRTVVMQICIGLIYFAVLIPAAKDAHASARKAGQAITGEESAGYVILMLLFVGPFALPLLWQNKKMGLTAKILLTLFVLAIVLLFILTVLAVGHFYEAIVDLSNPSDPQTTINMGF